MAAFVQRRGKEIVMIEREMKVLPATARLARGLASAADADRSEQCGYLTDKEENQV